jgi:cytochrome c1
MNTITEKMRSSEKATVKLAITLGFLWASSAALAADFPAPGNLAEGAQTWAENCTRCHNLRSPNELRDDQWISSVFHMRVRAGLTGKETRDVLTFIQAANATAAQVRTQAEARAEAQQDEAQEK